MQVSDTWTSNVFSAVAATAWVRYCGRTHLGKIRGGLTTVGVEASSAGPFVMGAGYDQFGGYHEVFWVFLVVTVPMIGVSLWATEPEKTYRDN